MECSEVNPNASEFVGHKHGSEERRYQIDASVPLVNLTFPLYKANQVVDWLQNVSEVQNSEHLAYEAPSILLLEDHAGES